MAKWRCDCGNFRTLRSDGIVEACSACGAPEHDALREAIKIPEEYEVITGLDTEAMALPNRNGESYV